MYVPERAERSNQPHIQVSQYDSSHELLPLNSENERSQDQKQGFSISDFREINAHDLDRPGRLGSWTPPGLRAPVLLVIIVTCGGLFALLQILLAYSQRHGGILFAADINQLPLSKTFLYLYLPTITATLFSILWSSVDLDSKRAEPWYQLSKPGGATAKDSLLLQYPFDFIALVPLKSVRSRQWLVFWASSATVLIFWGLTPLQGGIFATETITRTYSTPMEISTSYLALGEQSLKLNLNYTYSAYGIAWLNESLPPYMSRDFILAPFKAQTASFDGMNGTWTAKTNMYSVDVQCEKAMINNTYYTSSGGCRVPIPYGPTGNDTIGKALGSDSLYKRYSMLYAGYMDDNGFADFYLSAYCRNSSIHVFWASFTKNKEKATDPPETPTTLFCTPFYYSQEVNATVSIDGLHVQNTTELGPKVALSGDFFNYTQMEWTMNSASPHYNSARDGNPATSWPNNRAPLSQLEITQGLSEASQVMVSFALGADNQTDLEDYLNPEALRNAWEKAYRLLFSRAVTDVLTTRPFEKSEISTGALQYRTQAITLVPGFTRAIQGILLFLCVVALILLVLSARRKCVLTSDPATLSAVISIAANSASSTHKSAQPGEELDGARYALLKKDDQIALEQMNYGQQEGSALRNQTVQEDTTHHSTPVEYRTWYATVFLLANLGFLSAVVVMQRLTAVNGLPLPSNNRLVRQIVEKAIPIVLATLIEPLWLVLNRIICLLQPFEALRSGKASASESLNLQYMSLPPQLYIVKALLYRHFTLAIVCAMALLANFLAVAANGLLNEDDITIQRPASFATRYSPVITNGSIATYMNMTNSTGGFLPVITFLNTSIKYPEEAVYVAMSNITSQTQLPPWTDNDYFYVPFNISSNNTNAHYMASTKAFGARLECLPLMPETATGHTVRLKNGDDLVYCHTDVNLFNAAKYGNCSGAAQHAEFITGLNATDKQPNFCQEHIISGWMRTPSNNRCKTNETIDQSDMTLIACRSILQVVDAEVRVDTLGHIQEANITNVNNNSLQTYFGPEPANFARQMVWVFLRAIKSYSGGPGGDSWTPLQYAYNASWYSDSFPFDYANYFAIQLARSNRLLDPVQPPPSSDEAAPLLSAVYSRVFALQLQQNMDIFATAESPITLNGFILTNELRIVLSWPMFLVAVSILSIYILAAIVVFIRRPGRFLPRLPTTISSVLDMFPASHILTDLQDTTHLSTRERIRFVEGLGYSYGYGPYVGTDGKAHNGIERQPYLRIGNDRNEYDPVNYATGGQPRLKRGQSWRSRIGWRYKHLGSNMES